jgi:hypothetical protein
LSFTIARHDDQGDALGLVGQLLERRTGRTLTSLVAEALRLFDERLKPAE